MEVCAIFLFCATTVIASPAQIFTTLASFDGTDGSAPDGSLVQGFDGSFYGTTAVGGTGSFIAGGGTVFKITPAGTLTTIYNFCNQTLCDDGQQPTSELLLNFDGNFYGTTLLGGAIHGHNAEGLGTIFRITPGGILTALHSFGGGIGGADPFSGLVQGFDGNLYGVTGSGGNTGNGIFFGITPDGRFARLYNFCSQANCSGGNFPFASLVAGRDGKLYGTTAGGGANSQCCGTVFSITLRGKLTTLHTFDATGADGESPMAALVEGTDGNFYGTTSKGGVSGFGTVFKITAGGNLTVLHNFTGSSDGATPYSGALIQGSDGNFYGTTSAGTSSNGGTVFKITSAGTLTTLVTLAPLAALGPSPVWW